MKFRHLALVVVWTGLLAGAVNAAEPLPAGPLPADAEAYIKAEMQNRSIPGLAVAVVRDGSIVASQTYGFANLELNVPVTQDTIFPIASLDKQLTASGVMLLVQDGKIRLDDEISPYFTDPPASWKSIRVRHLLSHASGLPDVVNEEVGGRPFISYSTDQLLANVKRQALLFPPGTGYFYSDAGLFLSQLITEKASGIPWWQFATALSFAPAGMTAIAYMDPAAIIKNRVAGHELTTSGELISNRRNAINLGPLYNDVGATIGDFARWAAALEDRPRHSPVPARSDVDPQIPRQRHSLLARLRFRLGFGPLSRRARGVAFRLYRRRHRGAARTANRGDCVYQSR